MKLAYTQEFITEPIVRALERRGWETIPTTSPCELLNSGKAQIALAPTIEYARCLGLHDYALVPGLAIMTQGFAGLIKLVFKKGLVSFATVAAKEPNSSATLVTSFILAEKHDIEPRIVPASAETSLEEMLASADTALLAGDDAIFTGSGQTSWLDLSDEWEDLTETALPYMLAWGRVGEVPQGVLDELLVARDEAVLTLADYAAQHSQSAQATAFYQRYLRGDIRYSLEESDVPALETFFHYAFYYLAIQDIPAVKYLPDGAPAGVPMKPEDGSNQERPSSRS